VCVKGLEVKEGKEGGGGGVRGEEEVGEKIERRWRKMPGDM